MSLKSKLTNQTSAIHTIKTGVRCVMHNFSKKLKKPLENKPHNYYCKSNRL